MSVRITNTDIDLLTKLNELGRRYGLNSTDFETHYDLDTGILEFTSRAPGESVTSKLEKMKSALGCSKESGRLPAEGAITIINLLDDALRLAPRSRLR